MPQDEAGHWAPAKVRCKFRVVRIERFKTSHYYDDDTDGKRKYKMVEAQNIVLQVVGGDSSAENKGFWESTPSGEVKFATVNAEAASIMELDREFYVDFIPADA